MAVIQSGADTTLLTVDPTSAAARMTLYSASGAVLASVAGTTATSALPVQGVTGGVPMPVTGSFTLGAGSQVQLVAGTAAVGSVTLGAPLPAGTNGLGSVTLGAGNASIGSVTLAAGSIVALAAGSAAIGSVTLGAALPAGTNSIGTVVLGAGSAAIGTVALAAGSAVALAAGSAAIGSVTLGAPLPAGTNAIGTVALAGGSTVALAAGAAAIGTVSLTGSLPAGTNALGSVTLSAALPAGANTIGNVGLTGSLPAGTNAIGTVVLGAGSAAVGSVTLGAALPAGGNTIGTVGLSAGTTVALAAGAAAIGSVTLGAAIPTGANLIGSVSQGLPNSVNNGWPTIHGELASDAIGTFTTGTPTGVVSTLSVAASIDGYNSVLVSVSGTFTGASGVFEYTDDGGATWFVCGGVRGDGSGLVDQAYALLAAPRTWFVNVGGADAIRVRSTAVASGTVNVRMSIMSAPIPGALPHGVSLLPGTSNIGNVGITNPTAQAAGIYASLNPYGSLRVTPEPSPVFFDPFDGSIDANKWITGGTVTPVITGGTAAINSGTTANATSRLTSIPSFVSPGLGFEVLGLTVQVEASPVANVYRFWGWASEPGTPAYQGAAATFSPAVTDATGFELDTAGNLYGVVYASSQLAYRTPAISQTLWRDGGIHRYAIMKRTDVIFWFVEGQDAPVASVSYRAPTIQTLPVKFGSYNGSTAPAAYTFNCSAIAVHDSTNASQQLSDGTYAFRKAAITAKGLQGTYGLNTQDLKDTGRTALVITANTPLNTLSGTAGTETTLGVMYSRAGAAMSSGVTTVQVTTGKTLRIQSLTLMARAFTATAAAVQVTLRISTAGAVTTTSPILWSGALSVPATVAQVGTVINVDFPDGLEVPSAANIGFTYNQTTAAVIGMSGNVIGYEY